MSIPGDYIVPGGPNWSPRYEPTHHIGEDRWPRAPHRPSPPWPPLTPGPERSGPPPPKTATATAEDDWRREITEALEKLDSKQLRQILDRCRVWTRGR